MFSFVFQPPYTPSLTVSRISILFRRIYAFIRAIYGFIKVIYGFIKAFLPAARAGRACRACRSFLSIQNKLFVPSSGIGATAWLVSGRAACYTFIIRYRYRTATRRTIRSKSHDRLERRVPARLYAMASRYSICRRRRRHPTKRKRRGKRHMRSLAEIIRRNNAELPDWARDRRPVSPSPPQDTAAKAPPTKARQALERALKR